MELSIKPILLMVAVVLTGLSAGLFYGWEVSVIPGTKRVSTAAYLETMQQINRAILNPRFFIVFFVSFFMLVAGSYSLKSASLPAFYFLLASTVVYFVGTLLVTGAGNVPINNVLDAQNLELLSSEDLESLRKKIESRWNQLHSIRTWCSVLAFVLSVVSLYFYSSSNS